MRLDVSRWLASGERMLDLAPWGRPSVLVRGERSLFVMPRACPHQGLPLVGARVSGDLLWCRWHGCRFALRPLAGVRPANVLPAVPCPASDDGWLDLPD